MPGIQWSRDRILACCLCVIAIVGGALAFPISYLENTNVLIGLCLFPFCVFSTDSPRNNVLFALCVVLFGALALKYGVRIFYFFSLAFFVLWIIEMFIGRLNVLILFLTVFMSPVFVQVVTILGFPLRLILSNYGGSLLKIAGANVQVEGNVMMVDHAAFSVDEACMGLNMFAFSMLMGVFVLAYRYKTSRTSLGLFATSFFFALVFVLNLVTNMIRIFTLVYFRVLPENPMHEFIGAVCLIVYVVIPLHFLSGWLVRRFGQSLKSQDLPLVLAPGNIAWMIVLPLVILSVGASLEKIRLASATYAKVDFSDAAPEKLGDGITKIATKDLLIYIKTIPEFFTGEHTPLMCWKGSGYQFSRVTTQEVAGVSIYKGVLAKNGHVLHTAWWYSNGEIKTISQLDWRMRMLKGEAKFCLVNVSARDEQTLMDSISAMFRNNSMVIKS